MSRDSSNHMTDKDSLLYKGIDFSNMKSLAEGFGIGVLKNSTTPDLNMVSPALVTQKMHEMQRTQNAQSKKAENVELDEVGKQVLEALQKVDLAHPADAPPPVQSKSVDLFSPVAEQTTLSSPDKTSMPIQRYSREEFEEKVQRSLNISKPGKVREKGFASFCLWVWQVLLTHTVDLIVVLMSVWMAYCLYSVFDQGTWSAVSQVSQSMRSFYATRGLGEVVLSLYFCVFVYWAIFRLMIGKTIGQTLLKNLEN